LRQQNGIISVKYENNLCFVQSILYLRLMSSKGSQDSDPEILLWKTVVNDDKKAFEKLFGLYYPPLFAYAKRYIEERSIREDIVQDVFVSLWADRKKLLISVSVVNYLMVSVRNRCLNYLRKESVERRYKESVIEKNSLYQQEEDDLYILTELQELLDKALSTLPETYRLVFEMYHMKGKDFTEIAETLNISVRSAQRYKSQVVDVLKKEMKDYLPLLILICPYFTNNL